MSFYITVQIVGPGVYFLFMYIWRTLFLYDCLDALCFQELKWVVERTLGSSQDDEVAVEAAVKLLAGGGGGGGSDWGKVSGGSATRPAEGGEKASAVNGDASVDEETPSPGEAFIS